MYKQVIVVRIDLKMSPGKLSAQVAHASVSSASVAEKKDLEKWESEGSKKVVLKVQNITELHEIKRKAKSLDLPCFLIRDAGHTQVKPGTVTCLGIGPAKESEIDKVTKNLKLL